MDYKDSGVDVNAGYRSVELIKRHAAKTLNANVLTGIGGFGGLFSIKSAKDMDDPVLVSGTDGVGTKLKIAFLADKHDTIGIDAVAMCVNDIICAGAAPLYFLDYIACGKNYPEKIESIVKGVADGCVLAGVSLIGGETAEMPGFYEDGEYDIAGFAVGIVDKKNIIDGAKIRPDDVLIGLASSGLHSNGYSLVRKIADLKQKSEELLTPTRIYVKSVLRLISEVKVKGIANITGGGFIENIPRMFPEGLNAEIRKGTWEVLPIFPYLQERGNVSEKDMYNTFNMGIGMVLAVDCGDAEKAVSVLNDSGEKAYIIGKVIRGKEIVIC
ncbi:phosphoribosylformylglycinamidine cyclo-ligase [Clostridia bacterium]|nr:phosphoribosylformylglycinamidine cyclo-ligase [Clostridia bacterium]